MKLSTSNFQLQIGSGVPAHRRPQRQNTSETNRPHNTQWIKATPPLPIDEYQPTRQRDFPIRRPSHRGANGKYFTDKGSQHLAHHSSHQLGARTYDTSTRAHAHSTNREFRVTYSL
ncbi:hypothetical protein TbgDal_XI5080 [Trypanosoma brucei gambiense DAL972]|uniref:Uncharacterized protein n=1 Tax=Trypanosoma brucei gambiense (strain MHOM/CI/86/DAL972) TaxID=679716 RepID=D0A6T9_TRYB9|nr:hypothetical protein TbgDal_XI5080 [Trypanosoma brucei gambiense DAL972]CBH17390.1 hypothetical protein TbgDal_XI5080 [Trypanosoma brucei gambiense DAL972]|eukprot:XP_011779654.1 hypothetical protein TbgDal_XI5080 [Trypanosoma brucei gambiense DAL972]